MYTKHRHELRPTRKSWPGTIVDPCILSGFVDNSPLGRRNTIVWVDNVQMYIVQYRYLMYSVCTLCSTYSKFGLGEIGVVYLPSQLEPAPQLVVMVDRVKWGGLILPSWWNVRQKVAIATLCVLYDVKHGLLWTMEIDNLTQMWLVKKAMSQAVLCFQGLRLFLQWSFSKMFVWPL
jgi:hypothetical protein